MSINKRIRPCPQHEIGATPARPVYLLRTCPRCMKWLADHPEDAGMKCASIPGKYASPLQGAYNRHADRKRQVLAAEKRAKARSAYVPPRFEP